MNTQSYQFLNAINYIALLIMPNRWNLHFGGCPPDRIFKCKGFSTSLPPKVESRQMFKTFPFTLLFETRDRLVSYQNNHMKGRTNWNGA